MSNSLNMIWIDLEMTGLSPENDRIIEIATIVTDEALNVVAQGPVLAVTQEKARLDAMDEWNTKQHNRSGLVKRVLEDSVPEQEAEQLTIDFLRQHVSAGASPMCGNSICQDRRFLCLYMPRLANFFHYRNLDVSTLKELAKRWAPKIYQGFTKESKHLALDDIKDSIEELRYYREHFIKF